MQDTDQRVSIDGVTFIKTDTADIMNAISTVIPSSGYGVTLGDTCTFQGTVTKVPSPAHLIQSSSFITRTIAYGNINNNGTASISAARGIASVNRTGVGVVEITLNEPISASNTVIPTAMPKGSATMCFCTASSDTVFVVNTRNPSTNAAVDGGFYFQVNGY